MKITQTAIEGCFLCEVDKFTDHRGSFFEVFNESIQIEGLPNKWAQDNMAHSRKGVFRGLHLQRINPQGKLVRCIKGQIIDYCLDLRKNSPTFMKHVQVPLTSGNVALYCPPGTAHGYHSISHSIVYYKCSTVYNKESDGGVYFGDPEIGLKISKEDLIISDKDRHLPTVLDYLKNVS